MSKITAIVTGGAGFIGGHLVDKLIENDHKVYIIDNLSTGNIKNVNKEAIFIEQDIREDLTNLAVKPDIIYHIAALPRIQPSFVTPYESLSSNCNGTVRVLELARKHKAKIVYAGSSSFYFDVYANPYAHSKWIGEEHCRLYNRVYGLSVGIARFFNVYGPRQVQDHAFSTVIGIFERQKKSGEPLTVTGTGEQRRDFTHVFDIVDGLTAIGKNNWNSEIFNLGRAKNYSVNEVAKMYNQEIKYIPARPGEAGDTLADISFSKDKLGWTPTRNLPDYVEEFIKGLK